VREDKVTLRRRGIFYLLEGEEARELAPNLGLKLTEKKIISPGGDEDLRISCGFPRSGLDKYIGKLVRLGKSVTIVSAGEETEEIRIAPKESNEPENLE
jgi:DNA mismatch repair ATPase MutS